MSSKIKLDVYRLSKEELIYELRVRGLGDGSELTVTELRTVLRNALQLEKPLLRLRIRHIRILLRKMRKYCQKT